MVFRLIFPGGATYYLADKWLHAFQPLSLHFYPFLLNLPRCLSFISLYVTLRYFHINLQCLVILVCSCAQQLLASTWPGGRTCARSLICAGLYLRGLICGQRGSDVLQDVHVRLLKAEKREQRPQHPFNLRHPQGGRSTYSTILLLLSYNSM